MRIREAIQAGEFQSGDRLRENDIAAWLSMSRTPVREAMTLLESEGILSFELGRGLVVTTLGRHQVAELYKVRGVLEGLAASLAARYIDDNELTLLGEHLLRCETCRDPVEAACVNRQFHEAIYAASHNRFLMETLNGLRTSLALLRGTTFSVSERMDAVHREHRAIYEAIRARDEAQAEAASRTHMRHAELARLKLMDMQASTSRAPALR